VSQDFALQQLAKDGGFIPFGARANLEGDIDFVRFGDEAGTDPLDAVYERTREALAGQADAGEILAASIIAHVAMPDDYPDPEYQEAIQVHVETKGYSRLVLMPYRVNPNVPEGELPRLEPGKMVPLEANPLIFTATIN
jgi:hypothetical protein